MTLYNNTHIFYGVYHMDQEESGGQVEVIALAYYGPEDVNNMSQNTTALCSAAGRLCRELKRAGANASVYRVQWQHIPVHDRIIERWTDLHRRISETGYHCRTPTPFCG